ncbi:MAG TPA: 4-alpha-glucanotransferase [Marinagarivorans sp.]
METLDQLMYWRGIASDYFNYKGELVQVSLENRKALLRAMSVDPDNKKAVAEAAYKLDVAPWTEWVQPFQVVEKHKECCFFVNVAPEDLDKSLSFSISLEDGSKQEGEFTPSAQPEVGDYVYQTVRYSRRVVMCGALPLGYHALAVTSPERVSEGQLAVVPEKAYVPDSLDAGAKIWGVIVQLYTLRSKRNWGIGDLSDLKVLIEQTAKVGAGIVGLNPLHVLCTPVEYHCSPYSPSDRRYIEPLYIDPELVEEFSPDMLPSRATFEALRGGTAVDYKAVYAAKFAVFKVMFEVFKQQHLAAQSPRANTFARFVEKEGDALHGYCVYQVMRDAGAHDIDVAAARLSSAQQEQVDFYAYLQWLAQTQMAACQDLAEDLGMSVGLMRDLAVGADGGGAEVRSTGDLFCKQASVGAPPDPLAERGQNWGLPPMDPALMRATKFEHFINLLRTNMANCGALRIDHAMALMRLWWCPPGHTADYGAYIYYPFPEMLGLLKLESIRNRCMVIGEDMGVVPDEFREAIIGGAVFTNKLFYFERARDNQFKAPEDYMPRALAMLTNHDVPTLASWWASTDIDLRAELDLLDDAIPVEDVRAERIRDKHRLLDWLEHANIALPAERDELIAQPLSRALAAQILICGAKVASQIFVIQLEDLELMDAPVNVPGTSTQYANWQRKLADDLDDVFANPAIQAIMADITKARDQ